jgi:hypothetical protein
MEWSAGHHAERPAASDAMWEMLTGHGFGVRQLEPRIAPDGGIYLSPPLGRDFWRERAPHGEYLWCRNDNAP